MIEELLSLYQNEVEALRERVEFTVAACYPNLYIRSRTSPLENEGWWLSREDPGALVRSFSLLKLKEGYKLGGYLFKEGGHGNGIVWAFPEEEQAPEAEACERMKAEDHSLRPPRPHQALSDFMQVIDGDGCPLSYLQAAVLFHELHEFGAIGQGVSWSEDVFYSPEEMEVDYDWEMLREYPKRTTPCFFYNHRGRPVVRFYTIIRIGEVTWNEYLHTFRKGSYELKVEKDYIATGGPGIIL
ncbi:hypothetical protein SAMN05421687_105217 [Salimicrobium flavidum]|uniref:Uncharacterized protein n=2 Tax=Salimicrobium flavidum TaxID=570947 RepID=A0A1N7JFH9_9BACI|nr:hypothetical protein SAMN05421687_105217 [Salimicrobium flavidum]